MILVTAPTGTIGSRVLEHLLVADRSVRIIARDPGKLSGPVRRQVDVMEGSHGDASTIRAGLEGVHGVFWLPPGTPTEPDAHTAYVAFSRGLIDALPDSPVTHVVGVSALGRGWKHSAGLVTASLEMDDAIRATGVSYRALACGSLMGNILRQLETIRETGTFYTPTPGDLPLPHVAQSDVADVAANLLLQPDWHGSEEIPLLGPEDLSHDAMATTLSDVLGTPVTHQHIPMEAFRAVLRDNGASPGMAGDYVAMMVAKNAGMDTTGRDADRSLTPTTFRQWCEGVFLPSFRSP